MRKDEYTIYAHRNRKNGKMYVGITSQTVEERWKNGCGYKGLHFGRAIQKYGWDNFDHIVIGIGLDKYTACEMEKYLIKEFELTNPDNGYNEANGGDGGGMAGKRHTKESKDKIREARIRNGFTAEHKKHISESKQGIRHHLAKAVYQYDKSGRFIKKWGYMGEASKELNLKKSSISACCLGKRPSAGGFVWSYTKKG